MKMIQFRCENEKLSTNVGRPLWWWGRPCDALLAGIGMAISLLDHPMSVTQHYFKNNCSIFDCSYAVILVSGVALRIILWNTRAPNLGRSRVERKHTNCLEGKKP